MQLTNTRRKNPLEEARNPVHNRIRYQKRLQEEREAVRRMKEEATRRKPEDQDDNPIL